jgi:hypothetical protein
MPYIRVQIDLAYKLPLSPAVLAKLNELKALITQGKAYAEKINENNPDEENTVTAKWHVCNHDEGKPCGEEHIL